MSDLPSISDGPTVRDYRGDLFATEGVASPVSPGTDERQEELRRYDEEHDDIPNTLLPEDLEDGSNEDDDGSADAQDDGSVQAVDNNVLDVAAEGSDLVGESDQGEGSLVVQDGAEKRDERGSDEPDASSIEQDCLTEQVGDTKETTAELFVKDACWKIGKWAAERWAEAHGLDLLMQAGIYVLEAKKWYRLLDKGGSIAVKAEATFGPVDLDMRVAHDNDVSGQELALSACFSPGAESPTGGFAFGISPAPNPADAGHESQTVQQAAHFDYGIREWFLARDHLRRSGRENPPGSRAPGLDDLDQGQTADPGHADGAPARDWVAGLYDVDRLLEAAAYRSGSRTETDSAGRHPTDTGASRHEITDTRLGASGGRVVAVTVRLDVETLQLQMRNHGTETVLGRLAEEVLARRLRVDDPWATVEFIVGYDPRWKAGWGCAWTRSLSNHSDTPGRVDQPQLVLDDPHETRPEAPGRSTPEL